ncbi:hypothetical protein [Microbacterium sediminis]|uniref:Uncharacterized protein n=1 Tax=Microbacterium sediminis TaxID=904291 RepID=A0A1B9NG44_9MICO|nr:hypothetical protein [Microbacterium sediminis]OCG75566.1 hypothetical protein A7J15_00430 [Microbacterium sediminis]QBR73962.1 hypothetical protein E3O41_05675 [Microbacterium sediminis]
MYILLALVAAIALGIALHYALPHRATRGVVLTPGVAALTAAAVYAALTWAGWGEGNLWLWLVTLAAAIVVATAVTVLLGLTRARRDREFERRFRLA